MKKEIKKAPGIFPMPVLMIGTYNEDGSVDVMNAAWGMAQSMTHLKLCLTESHKTVKNMKRTGYCTVALGTKEHMTAADFVGLVSGNSVGDKFEKTGLHSIKSEKVDAPVIEEFPICMECKVIGFENDGTLVEVVNVLADEKYINLLDASKNNKTKMVAYNRKQKKLWLVQNKLKKILEENK